MMLRRFEVESEVLVVFTVEFHRITSIMFKPFLEQINGLEKAGTLKVGDQQRVF